MKKKNLFLARRLTGRYASLWVSVIAILLMMVTASILLLFMGKNPLRAFLSFLQGGGFAVKENYGGGGGQLADLLDFLNYLAPLILASLAFITAFKAGLFNIGISGQMLLAGFTATVLVGYNKALSPFIAKPLVLLIGLIVGGMTGILVGYLKYRFNIHEVVSTIMINYIISYLTGFFINNYYVDMMTRNSKVCTTEARLTLTNVMIGDLKCKIPLGLIIAILLALLVSFLFRKTVLGFEIKAVGQNRRCSEYSGIRVNRTILLSMGFPDRLHLCGSRRIRIPAGGELHELQPGGGKRDRLPDHRDPAALCFLRELYEVSGGADHAADRRDRGGRPDGT